MDLNEYLRVGTVAVTEETKAGIAGNRYGTLSSEALFLRALRWSWLTNYSGASDE